MISFQAEKHELVPTDNFRSKEEYVQHLVHTKAYEQAAKLAKDKTVLDIGCNIGYGSKIISEFCSEIIGVDVSRKAISTAESLYGQSGVTFQTIDGKRLPFDDSKFDLIVSFQVIEHLVDYEDYMSEIKRVLSPQGLVMFTTPNALIRLDPGMKPWNPFHVREFSGSKLKSLLANFFTEVNVYGLFAREPLYSIEFNRLNRNRESARKQARRIIAIYLSLRSQIKEILPAYLLEKMNIIRNILAGSKKNLEIMQHLDTSFQKQHSTDDFYYSDTNLEHALDLAAICSKEKKNLRSGLLDSSWRGMGCNEVLTLQMGSE